MAWHRDPDASEEYNDVDEMFKGDQIICLIDARKSMMSTHFEGNGDTHLANSLRVVLNAMKFKVLRGDNSLIGLYFFGAKQKRDPLTKNVIRRSHYKYLELAQPSAENIEKLRILIDRLDIVYPTEIGHQDENDNNCHLGEALYLCADTFNAKMGSRRKDGVLQYQTRIWVFTNDDYPLQAEREEALLSQAQTFARRNFQISLWYMDKEHSQQAFKMHRFWEKALQYVLEQNDDLDVSELSEKASRTGFDFNRNSVRSKFYKKRALFAGLMDIGLGSMQQRVGVLYYPQIKIAKIPMSQKLDAQTLQPLESESHLKFEIEEYIT